MTALSVHKNGKAEFPRQISHFQILERVYSTRWEDLFHAIDNRNGARVSLKCIASTLPSQEQQRLFTNERDSLKALDHPNIAHFLDAGGEPGHLHIVVEPLDGTNLRAIIEARRPLSLKEKLDFIAQAADAVHFAHKAGIIHRSLMPREIVVKDGGQVKLHGFHMRRLTNIPLTPSTKTQYFIAKLRYPAPEQVKGEGADHRADIFSLGAILYEFLCFTPPFGEPNIATVLVKIAAGQPEPLEKFLPNPPPALVALVEKVLAKKPDDRYPTAADLALDLRQLAKSL